MAIVPAQRVHRFRYSLSNLRCNPNQGFTMVEYITRAALINIGSSNLSENILKVKRAQNRNISGATFLSHSSKDDSVMPAVVLILEEHGASVYLDKKDESLQTKPPRDIAKTLRERIVLARKFIVFASDNIKDSKWVPWELGLADGYKAPSNVALFPAPEKANEAKWTEQEYLGIYDRIVWGRIGNATKDEWIVWNQTQNSAVTLTNWLNR